MAKTRKRKKREPETLTIGRVTLRRIEVPTMELVQINTVDQVETAVVKGRIVKLSPTVKASEKDAFDGPAHVARLRERGALVVVLAPRTVIDTVTKREEIETTDPRELVAKWFEDQKAIDAATREAANEIVLETMEQEGL